MKSVSCRWWLRAPEYLVAFALLTVSQIVICSQVRAQNINDQLILPPARTEPFVPATDRDAEDVPFRALLTESTINTEYLGRAAVFGDSTRLGDFAAGTFLSSAIPAAGEPFFGTGARANLRGDGSAIRINGYASDGAGIRASAHAQLILLNATLPADGDATATVALRQVFTTLNRLSVGIMDSAFSDPSAVPEVIDLAGPTARITSFDAGVGKGKGRLSYDLFSAEPDGFKTVCSIEQAISEIGYIAQADRSFSQIPDFVVAPQYVEGDYINGKFVERWHLQFGTVLRDIAFETPAAVEQSTFGWGTCLSGAYRFVSDPCEPADRVMFSVAYGSGISHYITDLNAAPGAGDAVVDAGGDLVSLPVLAWYVAYTHNWTDTWRSTMTYSHVSLDSTVPMAGGPSPYRSGDYVAVNLIRHVTFYASEKPDAKQQNLYTGVEFLYGQKETLNGSAGDAQRLMFVVAISK